MKFYKLNTLKINQALRLIDVRGNFVLSRVFYIVFLSTLPMIHHAHAVDLGMPIDCDYGSECFIERYYDHSSEEEVFTDHTCGHLSKDGYKATDFRLRHFSLMKEGIAVLAAEDGVVEYVRDGVSDLNADIIGYESIRGIECGNGIIIRHRRGYETQYCHLRNSSISVAVGDDVMKGQRIAEVGLSGLTYFPFLAFLATTDGQLVDPFTGEDPITGNVDVPCGLADVYPLWDRDTSKKLKYISTILLNASFSKRVPHAQGAKEGKFKRHKLTSDNKFIVFWVDIFGVMKGDKLSLAITSPDGKILIDEERVFDQNKAEHFQFIGVQSQEEHWPLGKYTGSVILKRTEDIMIDDITTLEIVNNDLKK